MNYSIGLVVLATFLQLTTGLSSGQKCKDLSTASPEVLISFLNENASDHQNAECVAMTINKLAEMKYEPSIPALVRLLDFRRPPTESEKHGTYIRMQGFYPAVNALEEIGRSALPAVLQVIKSNSGSSITRNNAISVWMGIYKYEAPNGVARLKQEADKAQDAAVKRNLNSAIPTALTWCNPPDKAQCEAAAKIGSVN